MKLLTFFLFLFLIGCQSSFSDVNTGSTSSSHTDDSTLVNSHFDKVSINFVQNSSLPEVPDSYTRPSYFALFTVKGSDTIVYLGKAPYIFEVAPFFLEGVEIGDSIEPIQTKIIDNCVMVFYDYKRWRFSRNLIPLSSEPHIPDSLYSRHNLYSVTRIDSVNTYRVKKDSLYYLGKTKSFHFK